MFRAFIILISKQKIASKFKLINYPVPCELYLDKIMDFSQHNKINSGYGMTAAKRSDCDFNNKFKPHYSQESNRFPNINNPNYQQQYQHHQHQLQQQHQQQQQQQQQQHSGLEINDNGKYIQKMVKIYEPHVFGGEPDQFCQPKVFYSDYNQHNQYNQHNIDEECEAEIEYYQCNPPSSQLNNQFNPFKPVIDSMRRFAVSKDNSELQIPTNSCQLSQDHESNNQTVICSHKCKNNTTTEFYNNKKLYKSHTKILNIPNGVRIITEILRTENNTKQNKDDVDDEGVNSDENFKECQTNDNWIEQYIETELTPNSEILKKFSETVE